MQLSTLVGEIPKIGPVYVRRLNKIGVKTIYDLFFHFPHRYEDFSNLKKISEIRIHEPVCIKGKIILIENQVTFRKRFSITKAVIKDETGAMQATWFNQPYITQSLKPGDTVCFAGKISMGKEGIYMSNPVYEKTWPGHDLVHTNRIVPMYPETKGLSSKWLRFIIKPLLEEFKDQIPESLPAELVKENKLLNIKKAICNSKIYQIPTI
jgi:ATP-dependent DNA helicase RecG